jgi:hypothetical protein
MNLRVQPRDRAVHRPELRLPIQLYDMGVIIRRVKDKWIGAGGLRVIEIATGRSDLFLTSKQAS